MEQYEQLLIELWKAEVHLARAKKMAEDLENRKPTKPLWNACQIAWIRTAEVITETVLSAFCEDPAEWVLVVQKTP